MSGAAVGLHRKIIVACGILARMVVVNFAKLCRSLHFFCEHLLHFSLLIRHQVLCFAVC